MPELPKGFEHESVDPKWYAFWESIGAFRADPDSQRTPFSLVLPPPNVTGSLHIGHALNQTLPDIVARWKRMQGFDVLWLPGTDHAGIATQNVVEQQLAKEKQTRHDLGREAFEARVWAWVAHSKTVITGQMRKLGSSVDWSRERFTLDPGLSRAVRREFVSLFREGLIYRDKYIVNWCPRCRTALSDLEVVHHDTRGKLYYIHYPRLDGSRGVIVATTRPETMLGDTAVAVNPRDPRYAALIGQRVRLPIIGRELGIIGDDYVDPEFGTGALKVTPAHDPNDFLMGRRHDLPQVAVIDEDGRMTTQAGPYAGLDRFKARAGVVERLQREGLLERTEEHAHKVGRCQRCNTVVEPLVSRQWFVKIATLAEPAIRVVTEGRLTFVPGNWTKVYLDWMENIHDWCISRQLWWGHRIPAWYCDACGEMIVAEDTPERCRCGGPLGQETDVLDTWFSSGLWPFSTMGWPDDTRDLRRYYPTDLMITGFDIIFFWVARMIMLGLKFTGDIPFKEVYITSLVRDAQGQKMSKSKGNIVDPLDVMDDVGADAFRFTLAALASPGMDIALSEGRLRGYRQFINKLWNVSRFILMNIGDDTIRRPVPATGELPLVDRWILHRISQIAGEVDQAWRDYRFDVAADRLYHFTWHEYADWYIEFAKSRLQGQGAERDEALAVLLEVHDRLLRLLHPIIPFVTEEIWQQLPRRADDGQTITRARFPGRREAWIDDRSAVEVGLLQAIVTAIRTVRAERGVAPSRQIRVVIEGASADVVRLVARESHYVERLAGLEAAPRFRAMAAGEQGAVTVVRDMRIHVLLGAIDRTAELERVRKNRGNLEREIASLERQLANPSFRARAPGELVRQTERRIENLRAQRNELERTFRELTG
ncbi:MAG: valine--tRNA ligase [Acidobacteria bacterium]|nr:valine--tRNA ligase [Acidobacteriota bacterium]